MAGKRGPLNTTDREFIKSSCATMSVSDIAAKLGRKEKQVRDFINEYFPAQQPMAAAQEASGKPEVEDSSLRESARWKRLQNELTLDECLFFEEEFDKLMTQFRGDVLPTEEGQIFDCIKFEILKSRNLAERKKARNDIARQESILDSFLDNFGGDMSLMDDGQRLQASTLMDRLRDAREGEQSSSNEYSKLQERQDKLMNSLKATRDQRVREIETGKDTIIGLIKRLQAKEAQASEGRQMELMRLAGEKEYNRLGRLHEYEDGASDRPILSADTVDLEEETTKS